MNYRVKNIGIAIGLAALAAILTSVYVVNYKRHVQRGEDKVTLLVAARDIPAGTAGADIIDQKMLKEQTVPRKAIVAGSTSQRRTSTRASRSARGALPRRVSRAFAHRSRARSVRTS